MVSVGDSGSKRVEVKDGVFEDGHIEESYLCSHVAKGIKLVDDISAEVKERIFNHFQTCSSCQEKANLFRQAISIIPLSKKHG